MGVSFTMFARHTKASLCPRLAVHIPTPQLTRTPHSNQSVMQAKRGQVTVQGSTR